MCAYISENLLTLDQIVALTDLVIDTLSVQKTENSSERLKSNCNSVLPSPKVLFFYRYGRKYHKKGSMWLDFTFVVKIAHFKLFLCA